MTGSSFPALLAFAIRRNAFSRRAAALAGLAAFMAMIVAGFRLRGEPPQVDNLPPGVDPQTMFFVRDVIVHAFCEIFVVLAAVAFGTGVWDEERQSDTLQTLLSRPVSRRAYYSVRLFAALLTTLGLVGGSYLTLAFIGSPDLSLTMRLFPAPMLSVLALVPMFALFGILLPRPAICALLWGFFLEVLISNMPGVIKAFTVNYYARSLASAGAADHGLEARHLGVINPSGDMADLVQALQPASAPLAATVLIVFAVVCSVVGTWAVRRASVAPRPSD